MPDLRQSALCLARRGSDASMADSPQATGANRTIASQEAVYSQLQRERLSAEGGPQKVGKERVCFSHRYVGTAEERARRDARCGAPSELATRDAGQGRGGFGQEAAARRDRRLEADEARDVVPMKSYPRQCPQ